MGKTALRKAGRREQGTESREQRTKSKGNRVVSSDDVAVSVLLTMLQAVSFVYNVFFYK
jgi:flagellar biosynthesis protein FlhB